MRNCPATIYLIGLSLLVFSCRDRNESAITASQRFQLLSPEETGITFINKLDYTEELNTYVFRNFYNGGGVGLGDINNDSLVDIFFTGNLVSNRLYLNRGNFEFKDISATAGVGSKDVWTTGVSMVDINADGWLDIYLCKSGPPGGDRRYNELFINNGDLTFTERAKEYRLDFEGLSTHAAFFDYDRDGDLDCYLLNNSIRSVSGFTLRRDQRKVPDPLGGNKLLRNDAGKFVDVSAAAGIFTSEIGFGLGVTIGDINKDNWPDIYVSNDFFERDYLYINNHDGTFSESLETCMREISLGSMGADMADINNDGLPEIFVTEMLPETDDRLKTTSQFENWDKYRLNVANGYYHQFSRNVLQLNNGDGTFSEVSRLAGVHATDWSWGALICDMDNDGMKDIFVANGIYKDLLNQDYVNFIANPATVREILLRKNNVIKQLIDSIPSNKIPNYAFRNSGDLSFKDVALEWGLGLPSHSNGSAYGDLDNDGDLDLVLSNVNMEASVYENRTRVLEPHNRFLTLSLQGEKGNSFALGARATIVTRDKNFYQELSPMRGFMSSVDYRLHFGLGNNEFVDTLIVEWPNGKETVLQKVNTNQILYLRQKDALDKIAKSKDLPLHTDFVLLPKLPGVDFVHVENDFSDFDRDRLLFNMVSNEGPCVCSGDVNNDKLDDFYIGGAKGQAGSLFMQKRDGSFIRHSQRLFDHDKASEDTDCLFFDADGDGAPDLYVTSGGNEFSSSSPSLLDRLYINNGEGVLRRSPQLLPGPGRFESTSEVEAGDYDMDGDLDLFVGARLIPYAYGAPASAYILNNDGKGSFSDVTGEVAPELIECGMTTSAKWADVNNDLQPDLIVVGDWMSIRVFINDAGRLRERTDEFGLEKTNGWYNTVELADVNEDGFVDFVAGNHGRNSRFKTSTTEPVAMYINDFDQNGSIEQLITRFDHGISYPLVLRQDLLMQMPSLKKKYLHYENYKGKTIEDIFAAEQLESTLVLNAFEFETAVWLNAGGQKFVKRKLPVEAQFSPVYSILPDDFDSDGHLDLLIGGNLYRAKPETGIYDASYGLLLKGDGDGNFKSMPAHESGVCIKGEVRAFAKLRGRDRNLVMVGMNNDKPRILSY